MSLSKDIQTLYKSARGQRTKFIDLMYKVVEAYASPANTSPELLNSLIKGLEGTGFEKEVHALLKLIQFHTFDKENNCYSEAVAPQWVKTATGGKMKRMDYVKANWLDLYLEWQGSLSETAKSAQKRSQMTIVNEKLDSIQNLIKSDKLSNAEKYTLWLKLSDLASQLV